MILTRMATTILIAMALENVTLAAGLDFEAYRKNVEPIFLKKREGHARCIACHEANNSAFHLEGLVPGATEFTEEQSKRNFAFVSHLVVPGDPSKSLLLKHPLSPEAGGDEFHSGGRQFASRDDPDFKVIAAWISQASK